MRFRVAASSVTMTSPLAPRLTGEFSAFGFSDSFPLSEHEASSAAVAPARSATKMYLGFMGRLLSILLMDPVIISRPQVGWSSLIALIVGACVERYQTATKRDSSLELNRWV